MLIYRFTVVRLTLWKNFAINYGEQLLKAINENIILLAFGITVKNIKDNV